MNVVPALKLQQRPLVADRLQRNLGVDFRDNSTTRLYLSGPTIRFSLLSSFPAPARIDRQTFEPSIVDAAKLAAGFATLGKNGPERLP